MSHEKNQDIEGSDRLRELEVKKLQHQIWEHRIRIISLALALLGTLRLSGLP